MNGVLEDVLEAWRRQGHTICLERPFFRGEAGNAPVVGAINDDLRGGVAYGQVPPSARVDLATVGRVDIIVGTGDLPDGRSTRDGCGPPRPQCRRSARTPCRARRTHTRSDPRTSREFRCEGTSAEHARLGEFARAGYVLQPGFER
jgi:hypothetical protein